MKNKFIGLFVLAAIVAGAGFLAQAKAKQAPVQRLLTIGEDQELTFPSGLKECRVFDSATLESAVLKAIWKGECEWIVLRRGSDMIKPGTPLAIQLEKPLVIEDKHPLSKGHPVVITNDTSSTIIFKTPKNGGCSIIINKPDVAIMGFLFEGAVCR